MKVCSKCGHELTDAQRFCGGCGTVVQQGTTAPPPQSPQTAPPAWPQEANVQHPTPALPAQHHADAPIERIHCQWCQGMNEKSAVSCRTCGAPLDIKNLVSESGWREAPRIKDMTEIKFGQSSCQVEGEIVPVAEINLGVNDSIFFEHHVLLWKDDATAMSVMTLQGGVKRILAGMPFVISIATGPGRVAFSRDATGELVVLPLHPGMELDVREHAFLLASHHINFSFVRVKGLRNILFGGQGMFMDRFMTGNEPGLLILHGYGNVFERVLKPGESILVEPGAFLYKDSSVTMDVEFQQLTTGWFGGSGMSLARMTGPGRVGIQSMYVHHNTE
ncbi:MAG: AIM24 family protein [Acidobacteriota bacterium]